MYQIDIDKDAIRKKAYLFTAAKSRFVGKDRTNQELYTLDMEDDIRETSAQLSEDIGGITISTEGETVKIVTLSYDLNQIKDDIIVLTRQKGKNVAGGNGISLMDKITFSGGESAAHVITPQKDKVFTLCKSLTARKAKVLSLNGGPAFDSILLNEDDTELFDSYYSMAFSDLIAEMAVLITSFVENTSFTITAGFAGAAGSSILPNVEQYLLNNVLGQFYNMCGLPDEGKLNMGNAVGYITTVKNLLSSQADSVSLLKNIISDAATKLQTSLYPLSKKALGTLEMYTYDDASHKVEFKFELKEIPLSSSAVQLIYNIGRSILVNGALSKHYTMAGIADDKNEAKGELEVNLNSLLFLIEDRLRFNGLFDQLFLEAVKVVRLKLLGYTKFMEEPDFVLIDNVARFRFVHPEWEASPLNSINFMSLLEGSIIETLYRYTLKEWWRVSENKELVAETENCQNAMMSIEGALSRRHSPVVRTLSFM